jgi:uncharacterized protein YceK
MEGLLKRVALVVLLAATLGTGGCASIVEGTSQTVTVNTNPGQAMCELKRGGMTVAVVNPTPGSVTVEKSKDHISVLSSEFHAMTVGNLLFGGIIGVAVDASSGAMNKYPSSVTVMLPPKEFTSPEKRDDFYDAAIAEVRRDAATAVRKVSESCSPDGKKGCDRTIKAIEAERDAQIEALKLKRDRARVASN